ncbi:hypothetical protein NKI09_09260 [Mesorhizobium sp. M0757]
MFDDNGNCSDFAGAERQEQAAGALGMSLQMLKENYGHHHRDWQKDRSKA